MAETTTRRLRQRLLSALGATAMALLPPIAVLVALRALDFCQLFPPAFLGGQGHLNNFVIVVGSSALWSCIALAVLVGLLRRRWWSRPLGIGVGLYWGATGLLQLLLSPSWFWEVPFTLHLTALGAALCLILSGVAAAERRESRWWAGAGRRIAAIRALLGGTLALNVVLLPATLAFVPLGYVADQSHPAWPWLAGGLFAMLLAGIVLLAREKTVALPWLLVTDIAILAAAIVSAQFSTVLPALFGVAALAVLVLCGLLGKSARLLVLSDDERSMPEGAGRG